MGTLGGMNRVGLFAAVIAGMAVATWQTTVAMEAIFVFRNDEPITSWLALCLGPLLTVVGCVVAYFHRLAGGITVLAGGLLSAAAFVVGEAGVNEYLMPYLLQFTLPVIVVAIVLLVLAKRPTGQSRTHAT